MPDQKPQIFAAMAAAMYELDAVGKDDFNSQQRFNFRGIDAVLNAVGPVFRRHDIIPVPEVTASHYSQVEIGAQRTLMGHARLEVIYRFYALDGSFLEAKVPGEGMDVGDKATSKAMSVAYRTALIQVLALPTGEPDPDSHSYERSARANGHQNPVVAQERAAQAVSTRQLTEWDDQIWTVMHDELVTLWAAIVRAGAHATPAPGKTLPLRGELVHRLAADVVNVASPDEIRPLWKLAGSMGVIDDRVPQEDKTLRALMSDWGVKLTEQVKQQRLSEAGSTENGQAALEQATKSWEHAESGGHTSVEGETE